MNIGTQQTQFFLVSWWSVDHYVKFYFKLSFRYSLVQFAVQTNQNFDSPIAPPSSHSLFFVQFRISKWNSSLIDSLTLFYFQLALFCSGMASTYKLIRLTQVSFSVIRLRYFFLPWWKGSSIIIISQKDVGTATEFYL